ncbi:MAG: three-Cys-motif partner protein TcmP [Polyangiaceae bacterium]
MAAPKSTVWALDPHTRAKHEILRLYLEAWAPILSLGGFTTIAYVDGFSGPGIYARGENGSPVIALNVALQHDKNMKGKVLFLFIEKEQDRAEKLREIVAGMSLPTRFHVKIAGGKTFEEGFRENLLDFYRKKSRPLPPTFAFIDPFGWKGVPFDLIKTILQSPSCEVLVNFMFEEINRFIGHPDQEGNFDALFGTADWRQMLNIVEPKKRHDFLHDLYLRQLRFAAGAKYVRSFEMRNDKDVTDYFLFFATNNTKGMAKMKAAMWKVDQGGEFRFSDATNLSQAVLFSPKPDYASLRKAIVQRFGGHETTVGDVEEYVLAETPFRETHYKKQVLAELERESPPKLVPIGAHPRRRSGTFSDPNMRIRFP